MFDPPGSRRMSVFRTTRFLLAHASHRRRRRQATFTAGRELAFYCGHTDLAWGPDLDRAVGIGGSEEAVIHLSRALAGLGWQVTVYNNCGGRPLFDAGVLYRPHCEFDPRERRDAVVLWRGFKLLGIDINADKVLVDLHDAGNPGVRPWRLRHVDRVVVRSEFHRTYMPGIPDHQIAVIPNGLDLTDLAYVPDDKDPYLLVNTSDAERSMDVLPALFREVRRRVPQARLQWAYGWEFFEAHHRGDPREMAWAERIRGDMADAGIECLGRLNASAVAELYRRAAIYAYPTAFSETDCISVKKAQACGCVPVATAVGALNETVQSGIKIEPGNDPGLHAASGPRGRGIKDPAAQAAWVDAVVSLLQSPARRLELAQRGAQWARQWQWSTMAERWDAILREPSRRQHGPLAAWKDRLGFG